MPLSAVTVLQVPAMCDPIGSAGQYPEGPLVWALSMKGIHTCALRPIVLHLVPQPPVAIVQLPAAPPQLGVPR